MKRVLLAIAIAAIVAATTVPSTSHAGWRGWAVAGMVVLAMSMGPTSVAPAMPPRINRWEY